jgi:hypothetical protein
MKSTKQPTTPLSPWPIYFRNALPSTDKDERNRIEREKIICALFGRWTEEQRQTGRPENQLTFGNFVNEACRGPDSYHGLRYAPGPRPQPKPDAETMIGRQWKCADAISRCAVSAKAPGCGYRVAGPASAGMAIWIESAHALGRGGR